MKPIEILSSYLVGLAIKHVNNYNRAVTLKVESVKIEHHHVQLTPDTPQNDWWGDSKDWDTIKVTFQDGSSEEYSLDSDLEIVSI